MTAALEAADLLTVTWHPRSIPLDPVAVVALDAASLALARRVLSLDDEGLARLSGVSAPGLLLLTGDELPWVDGVLYLGRDPAGPRLLMPTTHEPSVPLGLFELVLEQRFPEVAPPVVVIPQIDRLISTAAARPVSRRVLEEWLGEVR